MRNSAPCVQFQYTAIHTASCVNGHGDIANSIKKLRLVCIKLLKMAAMFMNDLVCACTTRETIDCHSQDDVRQAFCPWYTTTYALRRDGCIINCTVQVYFDVVLLVYFGSKTNSRYMVNWLYLQYFSTCLLLGCIEYMRWGGLLQSIILVFVSLPCKWAVQKWLTDRCPVWDPRNILFDSGPHFPMASTEGQGVRCAAVAKLLGHLFICWVVRDRCEAVFKDIYEDSTTSNICCLEICWER